MAKDTLAREVIERLRARSWTLACAESLTGGLFGAALTQPDGASDAFRGGVICYQDDVKSALLGVDSRLLEERGAVRAEVAEQMATGARRALRADVGVALTGFAGPGAPGSQPVGRVYIGVATPHGVRAHEFTFDGGRDDVRRQAAEAALRLARDAADERAPTGAP